MESLLGALCFLAMVAYVYLRFVRIDHTNNKDEESSTFPILSQNHSHFTPQQYPSRLPEPLRRRTSSTDSNGNISIWNPTRDVNMKGRMESMIESPPGYNPQSPPPFSSTFPLSPLRITVRSPLMDLENPVIMSPTAPVLVQAPYVLPPQQQFASPSQPQKSILLKNNESGPAQIQIEVARNAKIPLFLNSPLYKSRPSTAATDLGSLASMPSVPASIQNLPPSLAQQRVDSSLSEARRRYSNLHIDYNTLTIGGMIGKGAFGAVYKGTWRGTHVAIKTITVSTMKQDIMEEFMAEVEIMSMLRHPNICLLMGACLQPPSLCLVVELVAKGSLWEVLRKALPMDTRLSLRFARDTAQGMNYLHHFSPPILHRDLKSPNLLVDSAFHIKISDFGLARVRAHCQTMTGNCGTVQWMAPEILGAQNYTEKADVYSFGIVLWELVTRACPYEGLSQIQAALGVLNNHLRPTIPQDCPHHLKALMKCCWATNPSSRPSFADILNCLPEEDA